MPTRHPLNAPPSPIELPDLITRFLRARALGRKHYQRADRLLEVIRLSMCPGEAVTLPDRRRAVLVDRFRDTNTVYRAHGISRYDLEVSDPI